MVNWQEKSNIGKEYTEDKNKTSMRFDVKFYSPAELLPFNFFYKKRNIIGVQEGRYLNVSFIEVLPRKLIDDIANGRKNASRYVYGYIFTPIKRVNQEMLQQRYTLGHFLVSTFSFFDIASITLTNVDEDPTDEIIVMPWPPIFSAPPHSIFSKSFVPSFPKIFVRDYIDACNDFFSGDYESCIRCLITSIENAFSIYNFSSKVKRPWWKTFFTFKKNKLSVKEILLNLKYNNKSLGQQVVSENLLFLYKVRNKITHGSLRIHPENGWWFCGKALETVQYFYQFLDGRGENSPGAYIFRTYGFVQILSFETKGSTIEFDESLVGFIKKDMEGSVINDDEDMDKFKFNGLRINKEEKDKILNNKIRN